MTPEKPRLLDLFCGAGGAAKGYQDAGFHVTGVDIVDQPNYCGDEFFQKDALDWTDWDFDLIHASPPCQAYSRAWTLHKRDHPRLVDPTRELLKASGIPWMMENVPGSGLTHADSLFGGHGVMLCGTMFALKVLVRGTWFELQRHRLFESSFPITQSLQCNHRLDVVGVYGHGGMKHDRARRGFNVSSADVRREVMEMPWANRDEIAEAIPPAYTKWIGQQFLSQLERTESA